MKKNNKFIIGTLFLIMIVCAMVENTKGIFIPLFKESFNLNDFNIGFLLTLTGISYMFGNFIGGYSLEYLDRKNTMFVGSFLVVSGTLLIIFTKSLVFFYLSFIITNIGTAFLGLCVNTLIPTLKVKSKAVLMNLTHFAYGIGATITHKGSGYLLEKGFTYQNIYKIIIFMMIFTVFLICFENFKSSKKEKQKENAVLSKREKCLVGFFTIAVGFYISAEMQTGNWVVNYMKETFSYNENKASNFTTIFFLLFSFGRLSGGFIADKYGYLKSVIISMTIAILLFTVGISTGEKGLILVSISGLFFAISFPVIILSLSKYFKNHLNRVTSIVFTTASAINMVMGLFMGYISQNFGIEKAIYMIPMFLAISLIMLIIVKNKKKNT